MRRLAITLVAVTLLGPGTGLAQAQRGSLSGTVRSQESGELLVGVSVEVVGTGVRALTDGAGQYRIEALRPGAYTLRFAMLGHAVRSERVQVRSAGQVLDVALPLDPVRLRALTVLLERTRLLGGPAGRSSIAGSVAYVALEEERGDVYADVHRALRQVPGVTVQEEEGYGLRPNIGMRGAGSNRSSKITLMEDGVLIAPAPYAAPAAYYFPTTGRMEGIEIRKGSSQIKYGPHTIGGALNLISSSIPDVLRVQTEVEGGGDRTWKARLRAGDSYSHFGWLAETYQLGTDGFKRLDNGGDTGFELRDYLVKLRLNSGRGGAGYQELELKVGRTEHRSSETYLGVTDTDFAADPVRRYAASQMDVLDNDHEQYQLRHFLRLADRLDLTTTAYRNEFARNWYKLESVGGRNLARVLADPEQFAAELAVLRGANSDADALKVRANNRSYLARGIQSVLGLRLEAIGPHELELGIRYHEDEEDRFQHDDGYRMVEGRMERTSAGAPGSQSNRVGRAAAWSVFLQDRLVLGRWTLVPGVRYESIGFTQTDYARTDPGRSAPTRVVENGVDVLIPGMGVNLDVSEMLSLFGGVHKGFGPPGPGADRETRAEGSVNYELGARYRRGALGLQAVGFFNDYDNVLGKATLATGGSGAGELFNGGRVDVAGVELVVDYDAAAWAGRPFRLPLRLAYTLTRAEFRTDFESEYELWGSVQAGDELPYMPRHQLFGSASLESAAVALRLSGHYSSEMRTVAGQGRIPPVESADAQLIFDLSGEYRVAPWGSVIAAIQNLSDRSYVVARHPAGVRPGLPRTFSLGLRLAR